MMSNNSKRQISNISSVWNFFTLVIISSIPFWILGEWKQIQLLPGLPIDSLMIISPAFVALLLVYKEKGKKEMLQFLKQGISLTKSIPKGWYIVTILLMPAVSTLVFIWLRLSGDGVPNPDVNTIRVITYIIIFFVAALCEELGWTGYLIGPLQSRVGAMNAGIIIGGFWVIYHIIALLHAQRSIEWIVWWSIGTIVLRVIMVWLYNNTSKSVLMVTLFHMTINLSWQLFPVEGSYYSPDKTSIILLLITICIIIYFGPRTLVREKNNSEPEGD
jgi:membrane protease YdiL (CAAX protease family)